MAKVKIQGHASGTGVFTVTAPNSNTDRTITLPDADVTLGTDATKLPLAGGTVTGNIVGGDNIKLQLGDNNGSPCLEVFHDNSNSYIKDVGPGSLILYSDGNNVQINTAGSETMAQFNKDGASDLYHNGTKRLFTLDNGSETNGTHTAHNYIMGTSGGSGVLSGVHSVFFQIDSDNNSTGQQFSFRKDATTYNGGTELMKIKENGQVQIGGYSGGTGGCLAINAQDSLTAAIYLRLISAADSNQTMIQFSDSAEQDCGTITTNASANTTAYNTSSDYRLKENVAPMSNQITRLKNLKPSTWDWKKEENDTGGEGFLAHELNTVVPLAVTGEKDAMRPEVLYIEGDEIPEGKSVGDVKRAIIPKYQGVDYSKLVPLLTGALQEAVAKIEELETRITALEA